MEWLPTLGLLGLLGLIAGLVWLNLHFRAIEAAMSPDELRRFREESDDDMGW